MRAGLMAAILVATACGAQAQGADGPSQLIAKWADAFSRSDVDAIVDTYAPDALFVGTGSKTIVVDPAGVRRYFEDALLSNRPRGASLNSHSTMTLADGSVVVVGLDTVTGVRNGQSYSANGRVTFVVAKRGQDWKIVHFHRSAMPN